MNCKLKTTIIGFMIIFAVLLLPITAKAGMQDESLNTGVQMSKLCELEFPTYTMEIDISNYKIPVDAITFAKELLQFPNLKKIIMCDTGFTNNNMEFLMEQFPDIEFVWMLRFENKWKCRTDALSFSTLQPKNYTTTLNDADAAQFKYCTKMQCLDIGHNRITDLSFLQYMPDLRIFIVHANYDRKNGGKIRDLSYLKYCPKLVYLEIFKTDVSDLSFLQYTPNIRDLYASTTKISDITYLLDLPKLERLYIQDTKISREDYQRLLERYPNTKILYYGNQTVWENGWRNHPRYYALMRTIRGNSLDPLFVFPEDDISISNNAVLTN